jgi:nicotinamidase-related amidase
MAMTALDPVAALVVIDLQKGIAGLPSVDPMSQVVAHTVELARAFRSRALPVVWVNVTGRPTGRSDQSFSRRIPAPDWNELLPELGVEPADLHVSKQTWGAFTGTGLDQKLRALGVTQIVLAGVATCMGVESTARLAHELGYNVVLARDAMTDLDAEAQRISLEKILPRLGEVDSTENILKFLNG